MKNIKIKELKKWKIKEIIKNSIILCIIILICEYTGLNAIKIVLKDTLNIILTDNQCAVIFVMSFINNLLSLTIINTSKKYMNKTDKIIKDYEEGIMRIAEDELSNKIWKEQYKQIKGELENVEEY